DDQYDTDTLNILKRYKKYNGLEGNSPTPDIYAGQNADGYSTIGPRLDPDREDINMDNNLSETENYFQYQVSLRKADMVVGKNYITNEQIVTVGNKTERWYQFKIPIQEYDAKINGIN